MVDLLLSTIFILMYFYYINQVANIQKGFIKYIVTFIILIFVAILGIIFNNAFISWIFKAIVMMLFDLFYDEEPFLFQWYKTMFYGIIIAILLLINKINSLISLALVYETMLMLSFIILSKQRRCLNITNGTLVILAYLIILTVTYYTSDRVTNALMLVLASLVFFILEVIFQSYQASFEKSTRVFQQNILQHSFQHSN